MPTQCPSRLPRRILAWLWQAEHLADCPQCLGEYCRVNTTLQAISDDACTGRFGVRCQHCAFTAVLYGFVCERKDDPRAAVSLEPYMLP